MSWPSVVDRVVVTSCCYAFLDPHSFLSAKPPFRSRFENMAVQYWYASAAMITTVRWLIGFPLDEPPTAAP